MFLKKYLKHIVITFFSSVLLGCAASSDEYESAGDPVQSRSNDCFLQSSIRNYQVLDDSNLIVTGSGKRTYHVVLFNRAYGLRSSWAVGFRSRTGMICSTGSTLVVDDGFSRQESIGLRSVRLITPEELDALLIRHGKKDPEEQQAPADEEVEGAEVEELG